MKKKSLFIIIAALSLVVVMGLVFRDKFTHLFLRPTQSTIEQGIGSETARDTTDIVKEGLETPWSIGFLPNGDLLVTERSGRLQRIGDSGRVFPISGVRETSEGGLLGVTLHPDFTNNSQIFLYVTSDTNGKLENKIDLYSLQDDALNFRRTVIDSIPAASNHNGGGIAFGPDKKLYVTTGDAASPELAQDTSSLAGKILRLDDDGSAPNDNPFNNYVWSYGHRNPQGIAWDDEGRLWSVEHGPSGLGGSGQDELNLIEKGANYGWPTITGAEAAEGMKTPVIQSGSDETWAPAAMAYHNGSLFFAGLRGRALYQANIQADNTVTLKRHFIDDYGRLRAVSVHDDRIYFSTSNRDGRGDPSEKDDRIISVLGTVFE